MRRRIGICGEWEFLYDTKDIEKTGGTYIFLPHTYNAVDGQDGGGDYFRGSCVYKKTLSVTPNAGKKYFLEFEGVSASAEVFIDGKFIGRHDGGYSTFRFDITGKFSLGSTLSVIADNSANDRVYPQNADFTFYGGIYRDVSLIETDNAHFDLEFFGSEGIFVTPTLNADGSATVKVKTLVKGDGKVVISVDGQEKTGEEAVFDIPSPRLWKGREDPYLYTAVATLYVDGKPVDEVSSKFGIRSFYVDPNEGFFLNGISYPLRGVAMHQDRLGVGNAISKQNIEEDISLISEMGATTVRLSHYQHAQKTYCECDEKGLVVWTEIPYISEHLDNASDNAVLQMKELIAQNYNHPSIFFWGLSNEITMAGADNPNILPLHIKLNELCKKDKTRLTTLACISGLPVNSPLLDVTDTLSYNHYFGWYGGKVEDNGVWFDNFHALHPNIPVGMSEYGCENSLWHSSHPEPGDYSNEYQMRYHESMIDQLFARKYLFATHVWNMFDFAADARDEGGTHGRNCKGLVTFDRKIKKDAYFAYKARLSSEKVLHLCSKEFVNRDGDKTEFVVYSNEGSVELFINGKSIEKKSEENCFYHFTVTQPKGEYEVEVKGGGLSEKATFKHVEKFDESYSFGGGTVLNWFDITTPEGFFSVKDLMRDMKGTEAIDVALELIKALSVHRVQKQKEKEETSGKKVETGGKGMSEEDHMNILKQFSPLQLIKMGCPDMPKEDIIALNNRLNAIKKP